MRVLVGAEESGCTRLPYPHSDSGAENSSVLDWVLETLLKCLPYSARILWSLLVDKKQSPCFASL